MLAGAELGQAHFDRVAAKSLPGRFGCRQGLLLVRRTGRAEAIFCELVGRPGAAQVGLGWVGIDFPEEKIACRQVGVDFDCSGLGRGSI